eukprot:gnl/Dysnectes_brevis/7237_a11953_307.p2 GENE.gnl/Dysnectes_brevis/7237_a11953_307~~gnl/Dysnectes_brevis/7237_a11953_307.p2  ORF type:complete len:137 (+),score=18.01 gnl/Dysnectes_brevis/7237_a11953_307:110-520(+)
MLHLQMLLHRARGNVSFTPLDQAELGHMLLIVRRVMLITVGALRVRVIHMLLHVFLVEVQVTVAAALHAEGALPEVMLAHRLAPYLGATAAYIYGEGTHLEMLPKVHHRKGLFTALLGVRAYHGERSDQILQHSDV